MIKDVTCELKTMSRSTWACELKWTTLDLPQLEHVSRSTWACELKLRSCLSRFSANSVTLHVSVWVEIDRLAAVSMLYSSRSTWACELKFWLSLYYFYGVRHAPRERVSWNGKDYNLGDTILVTLHVSVWVEIRQICLFLFCFVVTLHVSVWVEIQRLNKMVVLLRNVTLHVSVWVEIWGSLVLFNRCRGHAPRERVSWNYDYHYTSFTLHKSRSTWACELK